MSEDDLLKDFRDDPEVKAAFIARLQAQTSHFEAATRVGNAQAEQAEVLAAGARRAEAEELARNKYHHLYPFNAEVDDQSVIRCIERLSYWSRTEPGCDIEIVFNSPGGSVTDGLALYDFIQELRRQGHNITTHTRGYAASMAGILLQAGDVRVMGKEAWVLIHEVSFSAIGKIGEVEDTTEWVKKIQKRIVAIFAERSKLTARQIERRWKRKDWWLSSDECKKLGLVDEVR